MSNIVIDIAAEFTGNKAFKQAESATDKLGKQAKKLAAAKAKTLENFMDSDEIIMDDNNESRS